MLIWAIAVIQNEVTCGIYRYKSYLNLVFVLVGSIGVCSYFVLCFKKLYPVLYIPGY